MRNSCLWVAWETNQLCHFVSVPVPQVKILRWSTCDFKICEGQPDSTSKKHKDWSFVSVFFRGKHQVTHTQVVQSCINLPARRPPVAARRCLPCCDPAIWPPRLETVRFPRCFWGFRSWVQLMLESSSILDMVLSASLQELQMSGVQGTDLEGLVLPRGYGVWGSFGWELVQKNAIVQVNRIETALRRRFTSAERLRSSDKDGKWGLERIVLHSTSICCWRYFIGRNHHRLWHWRSVQCCTKAMSCWNKMHLGIWAFQDRKPPKNPCDNWSGRPRACGRRVCLFSLVQANPSVQHLRSLFRIQRMESLMLIENNQHFVTYSPISYTVPFCLHPMVKCIKPTASWWAIGGLDALRFSTWQLGGQRVICDFHRWLCELGEHQLSLKSSLIFLEHGRFFFL